MCGTLLLVFLFAVGCKSDQRYADREVPAWVQHAEQQLSSAPETRVEREATPLAEPRMRQQNQQSGGRFSRSEGDGNQTAGRQARRRSNPRASQTGAQQQSAQRQSAERQMAEQQMAEQQSTRQETSRRKSNREAPREGSIFNQSAGHGGQKVRQPGEGAPEVEWGETKITVEVED